MEPDESWPGPSRVSRGTRRSSPCLTVCPEPDQLAEDLSLRGLATPVTALRTDPVLDDDDELADGSPRATWIVAVTQSTALGQTEVLAWPVLDWLGGVAFTQVNVETFRPTLGTPTRWVGHEGRVRAAAVVPGRVSPNARFGARVVTGGDDGTVRAWDPGSGAELSRFVASTSRAWLDILGTVRSPRLAPPIVSGLWAEPLNLVDDAGNRRRVLSLSTLGGSIDLLARSALATPDSALRFLSLDLPLVEGPIQGDWVPLPWDDQVANHTIRHGIYGTLGEDGAAPRLAGVPIEVVRLLGLTFRESQASQPTRGQAVQLASLRLEAVLANPAEEAPRRLRRADRAGGGATIVLELTWKKDVQNADLFRPELKVDGHFDWRFPLAQQVPEGEVSQLPGRLDRLAGSVALEGGRLRLTLSNASKAEAIGGPRDLIDLPVLTADPGRAGSNSEPTIRFRESKTDGELERQVNRLSTVQDGGRSWQWTRGSHPEATLWPWSRPNRPSPTSRARPRSQTWPRAASSPASAPACDRAVLVAGPLKGETQTLTAVGVGEDGTVRVQRLWELKHQDGADPVDTKEIDREITRYALPSPVEDVQVFDVPVVRAAGYWRGARRFGVALG